MTHAEQVASTFGCTVEQAKAQYAKNAKSLRWCAAKARSKPSGIYNGNPAAWYDDNAAKFERYAAGEA